MSEENSSLFSISTEPEDEEVSREILFDKNSSLLLGEDEKKPEIRSIFRCFNCGVGSHSSNECPEKYDPEEYRKNREAFNNYRKQKTGAKVFQRYHIAVDDIDKEEAIPGVISDKLREALGITKTQLPPFVYRMRSLGYPPGWLDEAITTHSGINMLNSNGERIPGPEEEEGEIFTSVTRYDFSKIVDFPGFNVWPSPDTINETGFYGAPEMDYSHSKTAFINFFKKEMEDELEHANNQITDAKAGSDMEQSNDDEEEGEVVENPSLKRKIDEDEKPPKRKSLRKSVEQESVHDKSNEETDKVEHSHSTTDELYTPNQSLDSSFGRVITVELGTPAVKIHSPFANLPSREAFRKDISDVINFENLPNTTGNYDKLKGILKGVREKLNFFKSNNDN